MEKLRYDFNISLKKCFWNSEIGTKFHIFNDLGEFHTIEMGFEYNCEGMKAVVLAGGK